MVKKVYISADAMLLDSYRLAKKVVESGFQPDFLIGIWRGGTPVGIAVHEYLKHKGINPYHTAIRTQSYTGIGERRGVDVSGVEHIQTMINASKDQVRILLVDDVFDTGHTMEKVSALLKAGSILEPVVRLATVYFKPGKNETNVDPDFFLHESEDWIVFPHELEGLTGEEIKAKSKELFEIISG